VWFVFQLYNLLPRIPAWKQIALPLFYKERWYIKRYNRALEVLTNLWMKDKVNHTPDMLSWWEQQRVSIARALVCNASIILADEPTGALDSKTGKDFMELLTKINKQGVTIIIVTHDKNVASYAHKIIHLNDGLIDNHQK
jgi:ABC-type lipoprotein export system ATPase subunit